MINATASFLDGIDNWVRAMRADDFTGAKVHADHIYKHGELLAIRPDFRKCMAKSCPDLDTEKELSNMGHFLGCVATCRDAALKS